MSNETSKISELTSTSIIPENGLIPIVTVANETNAVDINTLRSTLWFEKAYSTTAEGVAATKKDETFFTYADSTNTSVLGWRNQGGSSFSAVLDANGSQVSLPAGNAVKSVSQIVLGVDSFASLRTTKPLYEGQRVKLIGWSKGSNLGTGEFVGYLGAGTDDGGVVAAGNGWYWERVIEGGGISPDFYGAKYTDFSLTDATDYSTQLQAAVNKAIASNMPLVLNVPSYSQDMSYGYFIQKYIDISGLKQIIGSLNLLVDTSKGFTGGTAPGVTGTTFALLNLNGTFDSVGLTYNTPTGQQRLGQGINIRQLATRDANSLLSGQCHVFSGTNWDGALTSRNFNGYGVYIGSCWDWTGNEIRSYGCGNTTQWAVYLGPYPAASGSKTDETNNFSLSSLFVHDSFDRATLMFFTQGAINHIHQERTKISSVTSWVDDSATVTASETEYAYLNNFIYIRNSEIGQYGIYENADTQTSNAHTVVTLLRTLGSSIGVLNVAGYLAISTPLGTTFGDGNSFSVVSASKLKVNTAVRATIDIILLSASNFFTGDATLDSAYLYVNKFDGNGVLNLNYGRYNYVKTTAVVTVKSAFIERIDAKDLVATDVTVINYCTITGTITASGSKLTISGGSVAGLILNGSADSSKSTIRGLTIGVLTCAEGAVIDNCQITIANFTDCAVTVRKAKMGTVTYTGTKAVVVPASFSDSYASGNFQILGYYFGNVRNCNIVGMFQARGASLAVMIDNCTANNFNLSCDSGYFLIQQCTGAVTYWVTTNNTPALGSLIVKPDTGVWQRYTSTGWVTF